MMGIASSLSFADLYGSTPPGMRRGEVQERDSADASGEYQYSANELNRPAYFWVALVGLLVVIRLLWEYGGK
jgi:hypothetical protein